MKQARNPELDAIRSRYVDCDGVAASLGLDTGRPRQRRRWRCPSGQCAAKTEPTLSTPSRGGWQCHRCGAKGDAFALVGLAQGFTLPLRGPDFFDVVAWLAPHAGVTLSTASKPSRPSPLVRPIVASASAPPEPDPMTPAVVAVAWDALCSRQSDDSAAARWLDGRGIPARLVRSGFAGLDKLAADALADAPAARWLDFNAGAAVVAPLRSMRTGEVAALQARVFVVGDPQFKRRAVGQLHDGDGTPRVFGDVAALATARTVILVEGMADTWAAEALTDGVDGVVVIGASNAEALPDVAEMLKGRRVVVVAHLDGDKLVDGPGQKQAKRAAKVASGTVLKWGTFALKLPAVMESIRTPGLDLAAAMKLVGDFDATRSAFLDVVGIKAPPAALPRLTATKPPAPFRAAPKRATVKSAPTTTPMMPTAPTSWEPPPWAEADSQSLASTIAEIWDAA